MLQRSCTSLDANLQNIACSPYLAAYLAAPAFCSMKAASTAGQMPCAMTSRGKFITGEAASMLQNAGAERCEECGAAWPLQYHYSRSAGEVDSV